MDDDDNDVSYTYGERPDPSLMSPRYTQPGRKWIPLHGPYKGKLGAEPARPTISSGWA